MDSLDLPLTPEGLQQSLYVLDANQEGVNFLLGLAQQVSGDANATLVADANRLKRRLVNVGKSAANNNDKLVDTLAVSTGLAAGVAVSPSAEPPRLPPTGIPKPSGGGGTLCPDWVASFYCMSSGGVVCYVWDRCDFSPRPVPPGKPLGGQGGFPTKEAASQWCVDNRPAYQAQCGSGGGGSGGGVGTGGHWVIGVDCHDPRRLLPYSTYPGDMPPEDRDLYGPCTYPGDPYFGATWNTAVEVQAVIDAMDAATTKDRIERCCGSVGGGGGGTGGGGGDGDGGGGGGKDCCATACPAPVINVNVKPTPVTVNCGDTTVNTEDDDDDSQPSPPPVCCPATADWEQPGALLFSSLADDYREAYNNYLGLQLPASGTTALQFAASVFDELTTAIANDGNFAYYV